MKISDKLIELRKGKGWSQEEFAEKLDVSRQAISRWENGTALPDAHNIVRISKLFNVTADYLLNDEYDEAVETSDIEATQEEVKPLSGKGKSHWYLIPIICLAILFACAIATIIIIINAHTHSEVYSVKENEVAPSCTAAGAYEEVIYCAECDDEILRVTQSVAKLSHTMSNIKKENEVAPTCTSKGSYDEVVYCKDCNEEIVRTRRLTDMIAHQFQNKKCIICGKAEPSEGLSYMSNGNGTCFVSIGDCTDEHIVIPEYSPIGDKVTGIKANAFSGNGSIKSVKIPETVTFIGESAFQNCSSLESVNLPNGLTIINPYTFSECKMLKEIIIPKYVHCIAEKAFANCTSCEYTIIPANVSKIGKGAFINFKGTIEFEIYDGWGLYDDEDNWVHIIDFQNSMIEPVTYLSYMHIDYMWKRVDW